MQKLFFIALMCIPQLQAHSEKNNAVAPKKSPAIISQNPSKGYQYIGEVSSSTHAEIDQKVALARAAFPGWSSLDIKKRIAILNTVYEALMQHKDEIATLISQEMGMPCSIGGRIDMGGGFAYLRGYLDHAEEWLAPEITFQNEHEVHTLFFEGRGIAAISAAWNYPFCNFIWGVMQNLIVGNTVIFKHSEECPLTGKLLEEILNTTALPKGVFNVVHGTGYDVGEYMMNSAIDIIHFTGSTKVGKHLYEVAAQKFIPAILELGGSAPAIVCADADVALVAQCVFTYRFENSGQICDGIKRLIVHKSRINDVISALQNLLATKKIGDAMDPLTDIGPLVAQRQVAVLQEQVADALQKGAVVVLGGMQPPHLDGAYYLPTILTNITTDMRVWKEEVFGPVLPIVSFETIEEAIILANDTSYGLGGYVYTQDKARALRISKELKTGNVAVNGADYVIAEDPFGGCKNSGIGREHGKHGLRELCTAKLIALK